MNGKNEIVRVAIPFPILKSYRCTFTFVNLHCVISTDPPPVSSLAEKLNVPDILDSVNSVIVIIVPEVAAKTLRDGLTKVPALSVAISGWKRTLGYGVLARWCYKLPSLVHPLLSAHA